MTITVEKTYTDNPFVDNVIYYAKLMALNCAVKDEDEALANETAASLKAGECLIACVEGKATWELFTSIPQEILEKYIEIQSNLDLFAGDNKSLKNYLNSLSVIQRTLLYNDLTALARHVYEDHYIIMTNYLDGLSNTWMSDHWDLYNDCTNEIATYKDLFDEIPKVTLYRVVKYYLSNYDATSLDDIISSLEAFEEYLNNRIDNNVNIEIDNINKALRGIFISHYEMMIERGYVTDSASTWYDFECYTPVFDECRQGTATWDELFGYFPTEAIKYVMDNIFGEDITQEYGLTDSVDAVNTYLYAYCTEEESEAIQEELTEQMSMIYLAQCNPCTNFDTYQKCVAELLDYYDLTEHIPFETLKMILATYIEEQTNLEVYEQNMSMLNSYLNSLPEEERNAIKNAIVQDMMVWYPAHYVELNNYYRSYLGLPPIREDGYVYEDTLIHTYDETLDDFIEFKREFLDMVPSTTYPESHWRQELYCFDSYDIGILDQEDIINRWLVATGHTIDSSRYRYLKYLGDDALDPYTCRKAYNFQIMGAPILDDEEAQKHYMDIYATNREYVIRDVYADAYKFQSKYYNKFMIIFIVLNTIMDLLGDIPELIIHREVFDSRCIKYIFESYGIPFYSEIPFKYQKAMLRNLNTLIKYKSSTKNMIDICNLFGFADVKVFGYYLFKYHNIDIATGEYIFADYSEASYELSDYFVKNEYSVFDPHASGYLIDNLVCVVPDNGIIPTYNEHMEEDKTIKEIEEDNTILDELIWIGYDSNAKEGTPRLSSEEIDYNGARYTRLISYQKYIDNPDLYTHVIHYQDENGEVHEKRIINQDADVYIMHTFADIDGTIYTEFIRWQDVDYFTKVKADTKEFTLKFVKVPIEESFIDYKSDPDYIISYDEMVADDEGNTWDDGIDHDQLIKQITDVEFNAVRTKYISVETITDLTEQAFQVSYFYNMLFDNIYSEDNLTIQIPTIKVGHDFKFMDVVCYLFALMYIYDDIEDNIMYSPTQILYVKGYNFDEALDTVLNDPTCFTQYDENGEPLLNYEKDNIFDINERIAEDGYSYRDAFTPYWMRSFNLEADIDAIDAWLYENYRLTLDDFIVDDSLTVFDHVITLRDFYSLNNSYYQKNLFEDHLIPLQYNQVIKYAYGYSLYAVITLIDASGNSNRYVRDNAEYMAIIDDTSDIIYVLDFIWYITTEFININAVYRQYKRNYDGSFTQSDYMFYYLTDEKYGHIFDGEIGIIDKNGFYIFAADAYYSKNEYGDYELIEDEKFFAQDPYYPDKKVLNFGQYYVYVDGQYVLDPDNTWVIVERNGQKQYVLATETGDYENLIVPEDQLYILHSDGHFVRLVDTDYYIRDGNGSYIYNEEECFVITEEKTEWYDPTVDPIVYYKKLTDYYSENNWNVYGDFYVRDSDGEYIPVDDIMNPNNTYYYNGSAYILVLNSMGTYTQYNDPINAAYILVLQSNNDYYKLQLVGDTYEVVDTGNDWYVYDSDDDFLLVLDLSATYADTNLMIVVFNKPITSSKSIYDEEYSRYDPERIDNVWDENDWYYSAKVNNDYVENDYGVAPKDTTKALPSSTEQEQDTRTKEELSEDNDILEPINVEFLDDGSTSTGSDESSNKEGAHEGVLEMNGENMWYYRDPNGTPAGEETGESEPVGSGFYIESTAYIGAVELERGERYYMAFDVETNFTGYMQIYCTADDSVSNTTDRYYHVVYGEKIHVDQLFTANRDSTPEIRFLIYDYDNYPIHVGDYVVVSNFRFARSNNNNFIAQDIPTYEELELLYKTNEACYKYLRDCLANCTDYYVYRMYIYLYDSLMISKYNKEAFKTGENTYAKTYTEFLKSRDSLLYSRLVYFKGLDTDTMHKEVADEIIAVTEAMDGVINTYSYGYLYSYFPAVSTTYIQEYIIKIINWFKSWKVHMLGINTVYKLDDPSENTVRALEGQKYRMRWDYTKSNVHIHDTVKVNPMDDVNCSGESYSKLYKDLVQYSNYENDKVNIKDRVRIIARDENTIRFSDNYGNIHIILASDEPIVTTQDTNKLIISSSESAFSTDNVNEFILSTDETEDADFSSQILNEINLFSGDYTDFEEE